jgi:hypothetical protein
MIQIKLTDLDVQIKRRLLLFPKDCTLSKTRFVSLDFKTFGTAKNSSASIEEMTTQSSTSDFFISSEQRSFVQIPQKSTVQTP